MHGLAFSLLLGLAAPLAASGQTAEPAASAPCATLDACIGEVLASAQTRRQLSQSAGERLATYGDDAVDRLVPLLRHPDPYVRESAGLALHGIAEIDARHFPALVHAWRHGDIVNRQNRGNGWMPVPIARTGTQEALRLLWEDFLRDPQSGSNSQVFFALAYFGERLRPLVQPILRACAREWTETCEGVMSLFQELDRRWPRPNPPAMPEWAIDELVALLEAPSDEASGSARHILGSRRHPAALGPLQRELEQEARRSPADASRYALLIDVIAAYGTAGRESAPVVARFLGSGYDQDVRAAAALALGKLGDSSITPALVAVSPDLDDDWVLGYNVAESLGRLRAREARPVLQRLAQRHWHRGVRRNAERALNAVNGGPFAQDPDAAADDAPRAAGRNEDEEEFLYFGDLRYAGDGAPLCFPPERRRRVPQDPAPLLNLRRAANERLRFESSSAARAAAIRARLPVSEVRGQVVATLPVRDGELVAFNGGEFGGGLYHLPERGKARRLMGEPVEAMWRMGGRLYVAAGLAHLVLDVGHLYVVDTDRLAVLRTIRLPASPSAIISSRRRAVIVQTGEGAIGVLENGTLVDPETLPGCRDD